jgi:hypothetical protein
MVRLFRPLLSVLDVNVPSTQFKTCFFVNTCAKYPLFHDENYSTRVCPSFRYPRYKDFKEINLLLDLVYAYLKLPMYV